MLIVNDEIGKYYFQINFNVSGDQDIIMTILSMIMMTIIQYNIHLH